MWLDNEVVQKVLRDLELHVCIVMVKWVCIEVVYTVSDFYNSKIILIDWEMRTGM